MLLLQKQCPFITEHIPRERLCDAVAVVSVLPCVYAFFYGSVLAVQGEGVGASESETVSPGIDPGLETSAGCVHRALCYKRWCPNSPRSYKEAVWSLGPVFLALELCAEISAGLIWKAWWYPKESWKCLFISVWILAHLFPVCVLLWSSALA